MRCFAMTEPEVAGSDPTLIQTHAVPGRRRVGHQRPQVVHLRRPPARSSPSSSRAPRTTPSCPQAANTAFIVDLPSRRAGTACATSRRCTAATATARSSSRTCACPTPTCSAGAARATCSASTGSGPARLAHCMRWIGQAETALDMMVDRVAQPLQPRLAARREAGHPVDDRRLGDGAVPVQADGAARRVPDRQRARLQDRGVDGQALRRQQPVAGSSTARSRCTARSATRPTRRSPTCSSTPAGPASPTAPTRSTRCASPSARSPPTGPRVRPTPPPEDCHFDILPCLKAGDSNGNYPTRRRSR